MFTNEFLKMGNIIYFAPTELSLFWYSIPWFYNQGNNYFAPMELTTTKPRSGDIFVTPSASSVNDSSSTYQPHSGDTSVTQSVSSVNISTKELATAWRNKSKTNG